jgi:hypothetical protein
MDNFGIAGAAAENAGAANSGGALSAAPNVEGVGAAGADANANANANANTDTNASEGSIAGGAAGYGAGECGAAAGTLDYEALHRHYSALASAANSLFANALKSFRRMSANIDKGNLKDGVKEAAALGDAFAALQGALGGLRGVVSGFDQSEYFDTGEFTKQFIEACASEGLDMTGGNNVFEIFPYRIRIDAENRDVIIDRKKAACVRPSRLAADIKKNREKLYASKFNPMQFALELAAAYDTALLYSAKGKTAYAADRDILLDDIYKYLAPMQRFKNDYDKKAYAFDLARLKPLEPVDIGDGRKWEFGPSKEIKKALRITDKDGKEYFLSVIRFYKA